jgi:hypothetical protein
MGVAPLLFEEGTSWKSLGLTGAETVTIHGLADGLRPRQTLTCEITFPSGEVKKVPVICRIDTLDELDYFKNGGILPYMLRRLAASAFLGASEWPLPTSSAAVGIAFACPPYKMPSIFASCPDLPATTSLRHRNPRSRGWPGQARP